MKELYESLTEYADSDYYGFHMPGHKRNKNIMGNGLPYHIDITEIEGFDDLHHAKEILKDAQERAAIVYYADETCYLINGSTAGILSAVLGGTHKGGRILMARNCHKSVYAAVYMNELEPVYIYPEYDAEHGLNGAVEAEKIREILSRNQCSDKDDIVSGNQCVGVKAGQNVEACSSCEPIQAVVITSPTYDGVVSDVRAIAEAAHEFGVPLVVDEAHGAHFGMHDYFPANANQQGADVVIHSLHKTLPSLTQTALLHMNGNLVNRTRIRKYVHMLQTSSPSYVLMASMDECIRFLETEKSREKLSIKERDVAGKKDDFSVARHENDIENIKKVQTDDKYFFKKYTERLKRLRADLGELKHLRLVETENYDKSKIVISARGTVKRVTEGCETGTEVRIETEYTGKMLYEELLEKYHLQMEMASREYVLAMTSVCDMEEGFERLKKALFEIDETLEFVQTYENAVNQSTTVKTGIESAGGKDYSVEADFGGMELPRLEAYCTSAQADVLAEREENVVSLPIGECTGKVALEYAYVYPPGIPMIVPGERISEEAVHLLEKYESAGFDIEGLEKEGEMRVLLDALPEYEMRVLPDMLPECGER